MKMSHVFWLVPVLVVLAGVAMAIPSSPLYLPTLITAGGHHDGHSTSYWIKALQNPDAATRRVAVHALGAIGSQADAAVPELSTMMLEDPNREVRIESALALTKMGPALSSTVPALTQALSDPEPGVRMNAVLALMRLKGEARPAIPALTQTLKDPANQTNV